jgi:very-short-patch-repair endonuclease
VAAGLGLPPIRTFGEIATAAAVAEVLSRSPGVPLQVLESAEWNAPPPLARELVERGRRIQGIRERAAARFTPAALVEVLERDHAADADYIESKAAGFLRFLNFLDGRHRALKRRWTGWRQPGDRTPLAEQVGQMREIDSLRRERQTLREQDAAARQLFGALWQGEDSPWEALEGYIRWVVEFRSLCVAHSLRDRALETASRPRPDLSQAFALRDAADEAAGALAGLRRQVGWPEGYLGEAPLPEIQDRLSALAENLRLAHRWAAFEQGRARVAAGPAAELLEPALQGELTFRDLAPAFQRAFYQKWLNGAVQEREPLRAFHSLTHERRTEEFRRLDRQVLAENRVNLIRRLRDRAQQRLRTPEAAAGLPFLQREMKKQRAHSPLRRTIRQAEGAIRAIKPCFLMSPLTVAQLLDGKAPSFDLVVFDEASQLPPEDAVGAIARGRQLVVVGDPKQLPPTNFFAVLAGMAGVSEAGEAALADDGTPQVEDGESILESFAGAGVPSARLLWHYRSTHESLIHFSNVSFYESGLQTFPSVETDSHARGLRFDYVDGGVYEGKGINPAEARQVAEAVMRHARETPHLSLGVGTFSLRQQFRILEELEALRRRDPAPETFEAFFAPREEGGFFVKNLENIQGDERDVIFLSVTYGRGPDGRIRNQFGPLNGENGWRRLNVLTTRARRQMRVFASMRGDEINTAQSAARGAQLLRDFLLYAERGRIDAGPAAAAAAGDSAARLERDVQAELTRRGLRLEPGVGVAGYRVDFGVLDDAVPGRYVCGIECDGPSYRKAETARDRDRLRREVLEARGWTIHRVWSTDWFKDREGEVERLLGLVAASREAALAAGTTAEPAGEFEVESPENAGVPPAIDSISRQDAGGPSRVFARRRTAAAPGQEPSTATVRRAVLDALRGRPTGLEREELIKQARGLLGYDRTGPRLKAAISSATDALLASGVLGESSTGIRLREVSSAPGDPRSDATDT